jgi:hypothetical protein
MSASEYLYGLSEWYFTKYVSSFPITKILYFRVPFLFTNNHLWSGKAEILICCEELLYKVWGNHTFWWCQF